MARRKDRLDFLVTSLRNKKGKFYGLQTDMSKEEDILKAIAWVKLNVGPFHILINNAGITRPTDVSEFKTADAKAILDLNVLGLSIAAREAVKVFKEQKINGQIINMNSIAGQVVLDYPIIAHYTASKHAVTAMTQSLKFELKRSKMGTKVTVSYNLVCFG